MLGHKPTDTKGNWWCVQCVHSEFFLPLATFNAEKLRKFDGAEAKFCKSNPRPNHRSSDFKLRREGNFLGQISDSISCVNFFFCVIYTPLVFHRTQTNFLLSQGARKLDIVTCPVLALFVLFWKLPIYPTAQGEMKAWKWWWEFQHLSVVLAPK